MSIPKIIHQIWLGPNPRPKFWMKTWSQDYLTAFPEWQYKLWTETEIQALGLINQKIYDLYQKSNNPMKWAGMADVVRYEILDRFGGVYIDSDSIWVNRRDLSILLDQCQESGKEVFAGWEPEQSYLATGVLGAIPRSSAMKKVIEILPRRCKNHGLKMPYISVGPLLFNKVIEEVKVFPAKYFYPVYWHRKNMGMTKIELTQDDLSKLSPETFMYQFGYTTRQLTNNVNKKLGINNVKKKNGKKKHGKKKGKNK